MITQDKNSIIKVLRSGDSTLRKDTIESLMFNPIDDDILKVICGMLTDPSKGVRSSASMALSSNTSWGAAKYLVAFVSSQDIVIRNLAGEILMNLGSEAVEDLVDRLPGSNAADEKFIIDLLGQIGDKRASAPTIKVLNESDDENVILACIEALGNLRAEESSEILIKTYNENEIYQPVVMEALGKIGGEAGRNFMMDTFDNADVLTRYSIIEAFENIGDTETCQFLLEKLSGFDGPLSWSIIKTISTLQERYGVEIDCNDKLKNVILDTIHEADIDFKIAAAKLALRLNGFKMVLPFLEIYGYEPEIDEEIKFNLISNVQEMITLLPTVLNENPENLKSLLALLDEIVDTHAEAMHNSLDNMLMRSLSDSLTKLLVHSDEEIRRTVFEILFKYDVETVLMFLDEILDDENFWNRLRLAELLAPVDDNRAFAALKKLEEDENEMVSENAKNLLIRKNNNAIG